MEPSEKLIQADRDGKVLNAIDNLKGEYILEIKNLIEGKDRDALHDCITGQSSTPVVCEDFSSWRDSYTLEGAFLQASKYTNKEELYLDCSNDSDSMSVKAEVLPLETVINIRDFLKEALVNYKEYLETYNE